jgi:hypothetical protein
VSKKNWRKQRPDHRDRLGKTAPPMSDVAAELEGIKTMAARIEKEMRLLLDLCDAQYPNPLTERVTGSTNLTGPERVLVDQRRKEYRGHAQFILEALKDSAADLKRGITSLEKVFGKPATAVPAPKSERLISPKELADSEAAQRRREDRGESWGAA